MSHAKMAGRLGRSETLRHGTCHGSREMRTKGRSMNGAYVRWIEVVLVATFFMGCGDEKYAGQGRAGTGAAGSGGNYVDGGLASGRIDGASESGGAGGIDGPLSPVCEVAEGDPCSPVGATAACCTAMCDVQPYREGFVCLRYGDELIWVSCGISQSLPPPTCGDLSDLDVCAMPSGDIEEDCYCPNDDCNFPQRFWHNPSSGKCEATTICYHDYTPNNFATREACEATCGVESDAGIEDA